MRELVRQLKQTAAEEWRPGPYLGAALLLAILFWINYGLGFKTSVLRVGRPVGPNTLFYLAFYGIPYLAALVLATWRTDQARLWHTRRFWLLVGFVVVVLAANRAALRLPRLLVDPAGLNAYEAYFWQRCVVNLVRLVSLAGPVWLFWKIFQRDLPHFYGVRREGFHLRPYLWMLALMVPAIVWASFQPGFLSVYPLLRPEAAARAHVGPATVAFGLHEIFYALRFIGVEIFFRGFMVLGLVRWFGSSTLLPMVVLYAIWHFGKPFPEALGSIFGAYVLGLLALRTRSIFGGILIHMGIALLMDLAAFLQYQVR